MHKNKLLTVTLVKEKNVNKMFKTQTHTRQGKSQTII